MQSETADAIQSPEVKSGVGSSPLIQAKAEADALSEIFKSNLSELVTKTDLEEKDLLTLVLFLEAKSSLKAHK